MGLIPIRADAQVIGPVCFSFDVFTNQFMLFFTPTGPGHYTGTGLDIVSGNALTATVSLVGGTARFAYARPLPSTGTGHSTFGSANISLTTLTGSGRCEAINTASGCGTGQAFNVSVVECPIVFVLPDRIESVAAPSSSADRTMDGGK